MSEEDKRRVEELKAEVARIKDPFERIAWRNAANTKGGNEMILRLIASLETGET